MYICVIGETEMDPGWSTALSALSNLVGIIPAVKHWPTDPWAAAHIAANVVLSIIYHTCFGLLSSTSPCLMLARGAYQMMDMTLSMNNLGLVGMSIEAVPLRWRAILRPAMFATLFLINQQYRLRHNPWLQFGTVIFFMLMGLVASISTHGILVVPIKGHKARHKYYGPDDEPRELDRGALLFTVALFIVAFVAFLGLGRGPAAYAIWHPVWHVSIFLDATAGLAVRPRVHNNGID